MLLQFIVLYDKSNILFKPNSSGSYIVVKFVIEMNDTNINKTNSLSYKITKGKKRIEQLR